MIISIDTETNGIDFYHSTKPFFVTTCDEEGNQQYWEWMVNPRTRQPNIPKNDLKEIVALIDSADEIIAQNSKFDVVALRTIIPDFEWPWHKTHDTLIAGHLLASNLPHNLTDMAIQYLGVDIEKHEKRLGEVCNEARRHARSKYPEWRIARDDDPELPSAGGKLWKNDMWLPKTIALIEGYPEDHEYHTVLSTYSNADSEVTLPLWLKMRSLLEKRKLWKIYKERMKVLPIAVQMETRGVTVSKTRLDALRTRYLYESLKFGQDCVNIASTYTTPCPTCADPDNPLDTSIKCDRCGGIGAIPYELSLPRTGNNNSLREFAFDIMKLPAIKKSKKTGEPSLDKYTLEHYAVNLPERSKALRFVQALRSKRMRDTAISYLSGYERFWIPLDVDRYGEGWYLLHPSLNPTATATIRWSSSCPNSQNISKIHPEDMVSLRSCFGPALDREQWSMDAQNIEARLPAYISGEKEMIALYENPDLAPYYGSAHLLNFHTVYPEIWAKEEKEIGFDKVGPHCKKKYASTWYQWCKNGGFSIQYGAQQGTADRAFHRDGAYKSLKKRFSKLESLNQKCIRQADKYGYIETIPDKTVDPERGYPLLCTRTEWGKVLPTVPLNYYIQGSACWWTQKAMVRCSEKLEEWRKEGFDGWLVLQIHDELVFDFPKSTLHPREDYEREKQRSSVHSRPSVQLRTSNLWRAREIQKLMAMGGDDFDIPTPVGCEYHEVSWADGVTF